ncbi:hypothetical protein [Bacillus sp. REN10]|uniref:hypothetical protein n=1 Tax=Bacillus sp. REN10 TaxID=2782541 RepID=UPI00193B91BB|nr:hypothetical protein [Bacillus sp. REN10]
MAFRLALFLIGFGFSVLGGVSCIMYLNVLTAGWTLKEYIAFILERSECYLFIIGFVLMAVSLYFPGKWKVEKI